MWRVPSSGLPTHFLQCTMESPIPGHLHHQQSLLWEGAIPKARSLNMSHSGCYGPLPGLGHHILTNKTGPSKNSTTASVNHMDTENGSRSQGSREFRLPVQEDSQVPPLTSLPMVNWCLISFVSSVASHRESETCQGLRLCLLGNRHILEGGRRGTARAS